MRDVSEDAESGRIYFPQDELAKHQLTDTDILEGQYDERFIELMKQQGERARKYFTEGKHLLPLLDNRSRMCVNVMQGVYFEILKRIELRNYDVISKRVRLSNKEKIFAIGHLWLDALLNAK
jgi:phytoene synthase